MPPAPSPFVRRATVGATLALWRGAPTLLALASCAVVLTLLGPGCRGSAAVGSSSPVPAESPGRRVLVIINGTSTESAQVGNAYVQARGVPRENIVTVGTTTEEELSLVEYRTQIEYPIGKALKENKNPIDYIVTTYGMPIRIGDQGGYSLDAFLMQIGREFPEIEQNGFNLKDPTQIASALSPYFGKAEPFSKKKYGFYLVTRLTGPTVRDALRLIDLSIAAKPTKGPFLLDSQPLKPKDGGYGQMERILRATAVNLKAKGLVTYYDQKPEFTAGSGPVMGYASWGSNDDRFRPEAYRKIRFKPGAIAETFVSTSARSFRPVEGGQSVIADLLDQGVTGVKGYVSEPFTFALAHTNILFDRYTSGFNLADSFYMASPVLKWKDIVIGDPLCSPYSAAPVKGKSPALPLQAGLSRRTAKKRALLAKMRVGADRPAPKKPKIALYTPPRGAVPTP